MKESQGNTLTNNNINTNSISNTNSNTQEKPQRPKGIVLPQAKKRTREIVGPYVIFYFVLLNLFEFIYQIILNEVTGRSTW